MSNTAEHPLPRPRTGEPAATRPTIGTGLLERAAALEARVPPLTAGPRTDDERALLEKADALRAEHARQQHDAATAAASPDERCTTASPTFQKGTEYYAAKPPLGSPGIVIRVAEDAGQPGLLHTGKVLVETVGEDGRGLRKRWLLSDQLHDSPTTAAGRPRTTGYIRLRPGQPVPAPRGDGSRLGRISDPEAGDAVAAALRLALDDAARSLRGLGLSLNGSPASWAHSDSSIEWALRADQVFETLAALAARVEPYAATPEAAARRVPAAADAVAGQSARD
ncbi:hypothetical protein [Streptomyces sp. C]|uniref:hypothetical protein n=1 Tax=Streptomyces sp. C TaxID=253839 RepID=UPI0001B4F28C|nr:hypothetical protein [Streptomyces sp. C]EFL19904.1 predicted protein [Streptomyces sp. C]